MDAIELKAAAYRLLHNEEDPADYDALATFIDNVENLRKKFEWVSVKDWLPKDGRKVLLMTSKGAVFRGHYDHVYKCWRTTKTVNVTHWRIPDGLEDWKGIYLEEKKHGRTSL